MFTAKHRVTGLAAVLGWNVRDDGGPGKVTDYLRGSQFFRVQYDKLGRIRAVRDTYGAPVVTGKGKESRFMVMLMAPAPKTYQPNHSNASL
jgi:hypothetical protein